jgi:hypothetical protein
MGTMSSEATNDRKRKPSAEPEAPVVSSQDQNTRDSKSRQASTDASASNVASAQTTALAIDETGVATANAASVSDFEQEESMQSIGALIQDLFHSDKAKVNVTLKALLLNLTKDKNKCHKIVTAGGCLALVLLVKDRLKKATEKIQKSIRVIKSPS